MLLLPAVCFSQDITFKVMGVKGTLLYKAQVSQSAQATQINDTLGKLTDAVLSQAVSKKQLKQYKGSDAGVSSINDLGGELEILSDTEMNAYGWCYKVNGVTSDLLANQYKISEKDTLVEWYFSYAHLVKDSWTSMCTPADHKPKKED
jgi:hypothetical protein